MSGETARLKLAELPEGQAMNAAEINTALGQLDALVDCCLKGVFVDAAPASAADGDIYLVGGSPTGDWGAEFTYKLAYRRDGAWEPVIPFDGLRAFVPATNAFLVYADGVWTDWNSLIGAAETAIASAATCDIGAAGALFVAVTGTGAITSFGTAANKLRFLRFAGALTLTHDATSLILPGGASIVTAAGDTALFTSDAAGHWRCRQYARADGRMVNMANPIFSGAVGVGVSPTYTLHVKGPGTSTFGLNAPSGSDPGIRLMRDGDSNDIGFLGPPHWIHGSGSTTDFEVCSGEGNLVLNAAGTGKGVVVCVNNTEAWRTGSDGSLLVGTITQSGSAKLTVNGATGDGIGVSQSGGGGYCYTTNAASDGGTYRHALFQAAGGTAGSITGGTTGVSYNTTSDARLKTVSPRQRDYRAAIRALWVGDFTWKDSGAPGFGVLAQQAYDAMPNHQGVTRPDAEDGAWNASAEPFAHLALWGVKDLYALVEALAARVAALEAAHAAG
jgi:hypothetical protein